eukprot:SAG22_NODE_424_length_10663_cov_93.402026_18_plen_395_part_00
MEGPVVPKQLNYNDVLPVAIESRSNKRTFEPTNGTTFSPGGNRIIRLNINSDNLCDFTHSYLQFTVQNKSVATAAAEPPDSLTEQKLKDSAALHLDFGMPFIKRLQILSGGQELEDIDEYGRLYSMLLSTQGNPEQENELSMNQGRIDADWTHTTPFIEHNALLGDQALTDENTNAGDLADAINNLVTCQGNSDSALRDAINGMNPYLHNGRGDFEVASMNAFDNNTFNNLATGRQDPNAAQALWSAEMSPSDPGENGAAEDPGRTSYTYNIPLVSAILNNSKYWPLIFTNLGLDLYIHLEDAVNVGAYRRHLGVADLKPDYEITNVRYHAHLVDVDRSFYDRMRMAMQASGGVLQMSLNHRCVGALRLHQIMVELDSVFSFLYQLFYIIQSFL